MLSEWSDGLSDIALNLSDFVLSKKAQNARNRAREYVEHRLARQDFDTLGELWPLIDARFPGVLSRSTFYAWAAEWRAASDLDKSGPWTLANDTTGRPDLVMPVVAMLAGRSRGRVKTVTAAEATWIVRVALAFPTVLDATNVDVYRNEDPEIVWPATKLLAIAHDFLRAEQTGDVDRLLLIQSVNAMGLTNRQLHLLEYDGADVDQIATQLEEEPDARIDS